LPKRWLIGNNGCHFGRDFSQCSGVKKSVDKPANHQPHAAKKDAVEDVPAESTSGVPRVSRRSLNRFFKSPGLRD
jgi:hypothetical protein